MQVSNFFHAWLRPCCILSIHLYSASRSTAALLLRETESEENCYSVERPKRDWSWVTRL